jgi:pimeloyl-ACP methyl ester carboxylesterase
MMKKKSLTVPLFVDDGGTGEPAVLFLHGLGGNTSQWEAQLEHLRLRRRALALDLRGHGRTALPGDGVFAIEAMAADVKDLAESLRLQRFVLAGHSAGASVAIALAGRDPDHVSGLLLVDPAGDNRQVPRGEVEPFMAALEADYRSAVEDYWRELLGPSDPAVREKVIADLRATPREAVVGIFRATLTFNPVTPLRRYAGPKLSVITPLNDAPFSLHRLIPDLPRRLIVDTGHWPQLDRPEEINGIIDAFLEQVTQMNR